jgi:small subunit ribosomal protein S26e
VPPDLARELEKQGVIISRYLVTKTYCINCAVFFGTIKVRPREERKKRIPLQQVF